MITIIGIGNEAGDLTLRAAEKIEKSKSVYLRSIKTVAGGAIVKKYPHVVALDDCFEVAGSFDEWTQIVCDRLIAAESESGSVVYLTDGSGQDAIGVELSRRGCEITLIGGVGANATCGISLGEIRLTASEALTLKPYIDTLLPVHVTEIDDAVTAGELKLYLMRFYGDETEVTLCLKGKKQTLQLSEIDRLRGYDYRTELYIAAQDEYFKEKYSFGDLLRIMNRLTAPDGCPWDKAQTHLSSRTNMIEEAYEAVDALEKGNTDDIVEELGDVILQSVFHCDMGEREGEYDVSEVISSLCRKLVGRHTHIFGANKAANPDEALGYWEAAKSEEKSYVSTADKLNRMPEGFPALLAAKKTYGKLVKAGCDNNSAELQKAKEEVKKSERECARRLFFMTAAMSENGVDAEVALSSFLADLRREFENAEKSGDIKNFLAKL